VTGQHGGAPPDEYVEAEIQSMLAEDPDVAEQGITVVRRERGLVLYGEVESPHRREEILRRVAERFPHLPITSDIGVIRTQAPSQVEELP
jgi:RecB family endonuclease NucS